MSGLIRLIQSLPLIVVLALVAGIVYFVVSYTKTPLRAKEVVIKVLLVLTTILSVAFGLITLYAAMEGHVTAAEMFGVFMGVSLLALTITLICRWRFNKNHPNYKERAQYARTHSRTETKVRNIIELIKTILGNGPTRI